MPVSAPLVKAFLGHSRQESLTFRNRANTGGEESLQRTTLKGAASSHHKKRPSLQSANPSLENKAMSARQKSTTKQHPYYGLIDLNKATGINVDLSQSDFESACIQASNYIELLQKSTRRLRKDIKSQSSPRAFGLVAKVNNKTAKAAGKSSSNAIQASQSDGRSHSQLRSQHQRESQSRLGSTQVPLVMRHCYANNEEKQKQVAANQAAWLENNQSSKSRMSQHMRRPSQKSPLSIQSTGAFAFDKLDTSRTLKHQSMLGSGLKIGLMPSAQVKHRSISPHIEVSTAGEASGKPIYTEQVPIGSLESIQNPEQAPFNHSQGRSPPPLASQFKQIKSPLITGLKASYKAFSPLLTATKNRESRRLIQQGFLSLSTKQASLKQPLYRTSKPRVTAPAALSPHPTYVPTFKSNTKTQSAFVSSSAKNPSFVKGYQSQIGGRRKKGASLPSSAAAQVDGAVAKDASNKKMRVNKGSNGPQHSSLLGGASPLTCTTHQDSLVGGGIANSQSMPFDLAVTSIPNRHGDPRKTSQVGLSTLTPLVNGTKRAKNTRNSSSYFQQPQSSSILTNSAFASGSTPASQVPLVSPPLIAVKQTRLPFTRKPLIKKTQSTTKAINPASSITSRQAQSPPQNSSIVVVSGRLAGADLRTTATTTGKSSLLQIPPTARLPRSIRKGGSGLSPQGCDLGYYNKSSSLVHQSGGAILTPAPAKPQSNDSTAMATAKNGGSSSVVKTSTNFRSPAAKTSYIFQTKSQVKKPSAYAAGSVGGKSHQVLLQSSQNLGGGKARGQGHGTASNLKSRKHCVKQQRGVATSTQLRTQQAIKSKEKNRGANVHPNQPQVTVVCDEKYLDTIESVENKHLAAGHQRASLSPSLAQLSKPQVTENGGVYSPGATHYELPIAAQSPLKLHSSDLKSQSSLITPPLVASHHQTLASRNKHSGGGGMSGVVSSQGGANTYAQRLHLKESLTLRDLAARTQEAPSQSARLDKQKQRMANQPYFCMGSKPHESGSPSLKASCHSALAAGNSRSVSEAIEAASGANGFSCCCIPSRKCVSKNAVAPGQFPNQPQQQPMTLDEVSSPLATKILVNTTRLKKQKSQQSKLFLGDQQKSTQPGRADTAALQSADSKEIRRKIESKIRTQLNSVHQSCHGSMANLSIAKTESAAFQPTNPLKILRKIQKEQNYVWFACYDEDVRQESLIDKVGKCRDQCLPWEFVPWRLYDLEVFLLNESQLCLRREPGKETLCKIYLIHIDQVKDIVRFKNHQAELKQIQRVSGGQQENSDKVLVSDLQVKYQVERLATTYQVDLGNSSMEGRAVSSLEHSLSGGECDQTLSGSIPDEAAYVYKPDKSDNKEQFCHNYVVAKEAKKDFNDLVEEDHPPMLDLIYHETTAMGLPVVFATNRDQSKLDDKIPSTPSYFKHLKSLKPELTLLARWLQGLLHSFPEFNAEDLMLSYIEAVPGISGKLTPAEVYDIVEKAICQNSIDSESPMQPPMKLLTPQQTSKMFELMSNQQMDPSDLQSGYQSLSNYQNEQLLNGVNLGVGGADSNRDVVFLGAESSGILEQGVDLSQNQQLIIEQFNRDFQLQQQKFVQGSGFKMVPCTNSSDTSQVDNFIFQHNINRFSNEVSQDEYADDLALPVDDATPLRECLSYKNQLLAAEIRPLPKAAGTQQPPSRNTSSHAQRQESGKTSSYQGACRILNFQQPLFQGHQFSNADSASANGHSPLLLKDEQLVPPPLNGDARDSVISTQAPLRPPLFKKNALGAAFLSKEHSAMVDQLYKSETSSSAAQVGARGKRQGSKTMANSTGIMGLTGGKYFTTGAGVGGGNALTHRTGVTESKDKQRFGVKNGAVTKGVNMTGQENQQSATSLFVKSPSSGSKQRRSRNLKKASNQHSSQRNTQRVGVISRFEGEARFEHSREDHAADYGAPLSFSDDKRLQGYCGDDIQFEDQGLVDQGILGQRMEGQDCDGSENGENNEEQKVLTCPFESNRFLNIPVVQAAELHLQDQILNLDQVSGTDFSESEPAVSVRQQIVSELSLHKKRRTDKSRDLEPAVDFSSTGAEVPVIQEFDDGHHPGGSGVQEGPHQVPKGEIVVSADEQPDVSPIYTYQQAKRMQSTKQGPAAGSAMGSVLMSINDGSPFLERAFDRMNQRQIRQVVDRNQEGHQN